MMSYSVIFDYPGIVHGISTRDFGSMKNKGVFQKENINRLLDSLDAKALPLVLSEQVHDNLIAVIDEVKDAFIRGVDGLITKKKGVLLGVVTADCLPVLFFDKKKKTTGIAHAGYKGLLGGILGNMLNKFDRFGSEKGDIVVGIGPSIGVCCYDVPLERIDFFKNILGEGHTFYEVRGKLFYLNLRNVAMKLLLDKGIMEGNIEVSPYCTRCNMDLFYSYRGEGPQTHGEFLSVIGVL